MIGELKESDKDKKATLLQVGRYVRDVFSVQPTRRYIHAFTLCGNNMQAWVFDRSGPYSSVVFDIHQEPKQFIQIIAGYAIMTDEELGLDTFIEQDGENQFITVVEDATGKGKKLQLEPNLIAHQRAIVCRGTACFRAKIPSSEDVQHVVKFSWTSDQRQPEGDLLKMARERGVQGVAKLFGYHRITSISDMRNGLTFSKPHAFRSPALSPSSSSQSQPQSLLSRSFSQLRGLGKQESINAAGRPLKRSKLNNQNPNLIKENNEVAYAVETAQPTSLNVSQGILFDNRIFRCLVISPAGRGIRNFRSITELLVALRDSIKAHRSLYIKGKILHRDISENNIIITDAETADGFVGMLIDLDLAKDIGSERSGARHRTGTMEFMAIEVLLGYSHTYRHDLESFFYVLIWLCARRGWKFSGYRESQLGRSLLTRWYSDSFQIIARNKRLDMGMDGFEDILGEFPPVFDGVKQLCRTIRGILFPFK